MMLKVCVTRADSKEINLKSANEMKEFSVIKLFDFHKLATMYGRSLSLMRAPHLCRCDSRLALLCESHFFIITAEIFMLIIPWERETFSASVELIRLMISERIFYLFLYCLKGFSWKFSSSSFCFCRFLYCKFARHN